MLLEEQFGWVAQDKINPLSLAEGECIMRTSQGMLRGQIMDIQRQDPYMISSTDSSFDSRFTVRSSQAIATILIDTYSTDVDASMNVTWNRSGMHYADDDYVYDGPTASADL